MDRIIEDRIACTIDFTAAERALDMRERVERLRIREPVEMQVALFRCLPTRNSMKLTADQSDARADRDFAEVLEAPCGKCSRMAILWYRVSRC